MANDPIQGLRVSLKFADARNPNEVLRNLNLNIRDLDKIRNISDQGVEQNDIISLSGLTYDLEKQAIAIYHETLSYQNILSVLNNGKRRIAGNLDLSGQLTAPSFKFKTVDFANQNQIKTVDVSTSRSSAWSSFGDPSESIFYGGNVTLSGANSTVELSSIEFADQPIQKRFESQIPTHKVRINVDGEEYDLYAMKSIPLQFNGFFQSVRNLRVDFLIFNNLRPSWIIRNKNGQEFVYRNRISGSGSVRQSTISFFDVNPQLRDIEFYYPIDSIIRIDLDQARISNLPSAVLPNLTTLSVRGGDLIEMPDFSVLCPNLTTLDLSGNDLTRSDNTLLKRFTPEVVQRLITTNNTLRTLTINGCYQNQCTADLSLLEGLVNFTATDSTSNRRMTGTSPSIGPSVLSYNVEGNNFTTLHPSVVQSTALKNLNIRGNGLSGPIDTSGTNLQDIEIFTTGAGNRHPIVSLSGKTKLKVYTSSGQTFQSDRIGTNIFVGCSSLEEVYLGGTNVSGNLPNFSSNGALKIFSSSDTQWLDASTEYSIDEFTFGPVTGGCRGTMTSFNLQSVNLRNPIHPNAFVNMTSLQTLIVRSYGRGITGEYPLSINDCFDLRTISFNQNNMTGSLPNFSGNKRLVNLNLALNKFSGIVPSLNLPNLRTLYVQNNQLTEFQILNCPNLIEFNASFNNIKQVPNFEESVRLQSLLLNNNPGIAYIPDTLTTLTSLRRLEIANGGLNRGSIDRILTDLNENYNRNPRSNVTVTLIGNSSPSVTEEITTIINRLRREGWTIGLES
jgi:hypothetical protein